MKTLKRKDLSCAQKNKDCSQNVKLGMLIHLQER